MTDVRFFAVPFCLLIAVCGGAASAAPSAPPAPIAYLQGAPTTISRYVSSTNPVVSSSEGCEMAQGASGQAQSGVVVLDFGEPWSSGGAFGTNMFDKTFSFISVAQIASYAEGFLDGYALCKQPGAHLTLALGTSNYASKNASNVTTAHAQAWAALVAQVASYASGKGYANETVAGANDMETGWASVAITESWLNAYVAATTLPLYDYGDAGGCPKTYSAGVNGACVNGWTQQDIAYKSGGAGANIFVLPEIYNTSGATAKQWSAVAQYAAANSLPSVKFAATMTQYSSCTSPASDCVSIGLNNTPAQAISLLNQNLSAYTVPASVAGDSDITYAQ